VFVPECFEVAWSAHKTPLRAERFDACHQHLNARHRPAATVLILSKVRCDSSHGKAAALVGTWNPERWAAMLFRDEDEDLEALPFANRAEAGRILASKLAQYSHGDDVVVLGLACGGVVVASAVAGALHVPLDVVVVGKLGSTWNRELAMGAIAEAGVQILDLSIVKSLCVSEENIQQTAAEARRELEARESFYRRGRSPLELKGKTAILVDDGIATGCSILAAIAAIRRKGAARVVVAVPVVAASGSSAVRMEADEVISVAEPEDLGAVSHWYEDFSPVSDEDVYRLLGTSAILSAQAA